MSNILIITTGQETYEKGIVKFQGFVPKQPSLSSLAASIPIGLSSKVPNEALVKVHEDRKQDAIEGMPETQCGAWQTRTFTAQEGLILQIFGSRRQRWNSLMASSNFFIKMRANAAHRRIILPTLRIAGKSMRNEVAVEGRFDLITLEEAERLGVPAPIPNFRPLYSSAKFDFIFTTAEVAGEVAARERLLVTETINAETGVVESAQVMRSATLIEM